MGELNTDKTKLRKNSDDKAQTARHKAQETLDMKTRGREGEAHYLTLAKCQGPEIQ